LRPITVLVVDDERRYRDLLEMNLSRRGYRVLQAPNGLTALNLIESEQPDLVVVDLMLPDIDGYEICRRVREYSAVPIIMLTARAEQAEKVRGLEIGADDYVTKPFGADELLARVEAVLRRAEPTQRRRVASPFRDGDFEIDFGQHRVTVAGSEVELTPGEYRLLEHLALNAGRVIVYDNLLEHVWGSGYAGELALLQTAVHRLRSKIEHDPASPTRLLTKRGVGYLLHVP
jgi:two-component system, OmpR family, KDP operon response regulator KdpE